MPLSEERTRLSTSIPEVWRSPSREATMLTNVSPAFGGDEHRAFSRFCGYYQQLRSLPRGARRRLQRYYRQSLAGAALLLACGHGQSIAATIHVDASCRLIDAISSANADAAVGGCSAGSGGDTLVLVTGSEHIVTEVHNTTYGPTGLPIISSEITIQGNGSIIKRDNSALEFRLITVNQYGNLTLQQLTITGGVVSGEYFVGRGGGIAVDRGVLSLLDSTVSGNSAASGGGIGNYSGDLTLMHCTVSGNSAAIRGGGIDSADEAVVRLTRSLISGNTAQVGPNFTMGSRPRSLLASTIYLVLTVTLGS